MQIGKTLALVALFLVGLFGTAQVTEACTMMGCGVGGNPYHNQGLFGVGGPYYDGGWFPQYSQYPSYGYGYPSYQTNYYPQYGQSNYWGGATSYSGYYPTNYYGGGYSPYNYGPQQYGYRW